MDFLYFEKNVFLYISPICWMLFQYPAYVHHWCPSHDRYQRLYVKGVCAQLKCQGTRKRRTYR